MVTPILSASDYRHRDVNLSSPDASNVHFLSTQSRSCGAVKFTISKHTAQGWRSIAGASPMSKRRTPPRVPISSSNGIRLHEVFAEQLDEADASFFVLMSLTDNDTNKSETHQNTTRLIVGTTTCYCQVARARTSNGGVPLDSQKSILKGMERKTNRDVGYSSQRILFRGIINLSQLRSLYDSSLVHFDQISLRTGKNKRLTRWIAWGCWRELPGKRQTRNFSKIEVAGNEGLCGKAENVLFCCEENVFFKTCTILERQRGWQSVKGSPKTS